MIHAVVFALISLLFVGCSSPLQQSFPNADRSHLWTAMVATASAPQYRSEDIRGRWIVVENDVDISLDSAQIDVRRVLDRSLHLPRQKVQRDRREVTFSVYLLSDEVPTVEFVGHSSSTIPVRRLNEAQRYFAAVEAMLVPIE
ncbi:MAG: hypothetical protein QF444_06455 [Phycisphaerales bacterium]|jgi:hypothetical protein|nr:hypothetical protein [PVC group bacterium]MDP6541162.1 hypothetical protein [Phycisphaerales bacterium]MDP6693953.1 hypothetical protein [Phycisphaerales bacterium]